MSNAGNNTIKPSGKLMSYCFRHGLDPIAWSLRRLYCPVKKTDLVLEVGSGGNPYYRSNVLSDAYLDTGERGYVPLIADRPTVLAFVEKLPFKDGAFDFVVASHVLEHSKDPDKFLSEIQRVGKAGYIEVPDAFMERLTCYNAHRLEITDEKGELIIRKKPGAVTDPDVEFLFRKSKPYFQKWYSRFPFAFHVRYYWSRDTGGIRYRIVNPEVNLDWEVKENKSDNKRKMSVKGMVKQRLLDLFRYLFSQNSRNKNLHLSELLICVSCGQDHLQRSQNAMICSGCGASYPVSSAGIIDFTKTL